jgi:hypothetical protein
MKSVVIGVENQLLGGERQIVDKHGFSLSKRRLHGRIASEERRGLAEL